VTTKTAAVCSLGAGPLAQRRVALIRRREGARRDNSPATCIHIQVRAAINIQAVYGRIRRIQVGHARIRRIQVGQTQRHQYIQVGHGRIRRIQVGQTRIRCIQVGHARVCYA